MGCYGWIPMVTGGGPSQEIVYPKGSIYAIYDNIYHQYTPNVSIYTIHGSSGYGEWFLFPVACWNTAGSSQHQWMGQRNPASPKGWLKPYKSWDRPSFNWWFRNHPLNLRCPVSTCSHWWNPELQLQLRTQAPSFGGNSVTFRTTRKSGHWCSTRRNSEIWVI